MSTNAEHKLKVRKILLISGFALVALQLIASIFFMVMLSKVKVVPKDFVVMIDILLVLFCIIIFITQRWFVAGIITKVISLVITAALIFGCVYLNVTYGVFKKTTGVDYKTTTVGVYVMADNKAESIEELENEEFGIIADLDRVVTDEAIADIEEKLNVKLKTKEYEDSIELVRALYNGEVNVIIMNNAYIGVVEMNNEFADFSKRTKSVNSFNKTEKIEKETDDDKHKTKDVITIYVSGVDVDGPPTENRNSDVNILMVINKKTEQILLLNTPRDFYVETSVSNGVKDKLTHAGCYGVDCSVKTLEMFYGINIDHYIKLNFTGFVNIIDALGGVDVNSEFDFVSYHGGDHFVVGMNHMTGIQALGFARERYSFPSGDNQRGRNQMAVINAIIKKFASSELLKNYTEILNSISACMVTDMTMDDIADIVDFQIKNAVSWDIKEFAVGGKGDNLPCFSLKAPNYVMIPDENIVNAAKGLLEDMHNNKRIDF